MKLRQLGRFVRVFDVDGLASERREAGDRRERFRDANLFRSIANLLQRIELLVLRVDRVNRESFRVEQFEDAILERHQNVRNRLRSIDLIRDRRQLLSILELALDGGGGRLNGHAYWSPNCGKG